MQGGQGKRDTILPQIVTNRHFAAESIAASLNAELRQVVRISLHQNWDTQSGEFDRVRDALFVAEIRQRDQNALDAVAIRPEQF